MTMPLAKVPNPVKLTVALTDRCNLKCFICTREEFEGGIGSKGNNLPLEHLYGMEASLRDARIIQLTGFGETFLHPQLGEALDYIYSINPRQDLIEFVSNGTLLTRAWGEKLDKRLNNLAISLNAALPETYKRDMYPYLFRYTRESAPEAYRGKQFAEDNSRERPCQFERTVGRIADFMSALSEQSARRVALHYVVHRDNIDEMPEFIRLAKNLGISLVNFTHYMVNRVENIDFSIYFQKERYNAAVDGAVALGRELGVTVNARQFFKEEIKSFDAERDCRWPIEQAIVFTPGQTAPCCHIGGVDLGNAFEIGFDAVWNGVPYQKLRRERWMDACQKCTMFQTFDDWKAHFHPLVKQSSRFEDLSEHFVEPAPNLPPRVLVVGAGRDGARSLGRLVADLHAANGEQVTLHHEANSFRGFAGTAQYHNAADDDWMLGICNSLNDEIISGNAFSFVLPVLHKAFGGDLRVIHVKRDRDSCIASMRAQAQADPLAWGGYVGPALAGASTKDVDYDPVPPTAALLGEMEEAVWNGLSLDARLGWLYDTAHRLIEEHLHLFANHMQVATEALDDPATVRAIAQFINSAWRQACPPVHLNHGLRGGADVDQVHHHTAQQALADFDLHRMAASDTYPVIYFLQRMIAGHNWVDPSDALADLEILRGEIKALVDRAEGGVAAVGGQGTNRNSANLYLVSDTGLSPAKAGRLDDFFADFEPEKLEDSSAYPVIYFLQRLMALRQVTGEGDAELAATYRFMGDQVNDLIQKTGVSGSSR
jgi:MoaA/NifB/PqqE/SkfB family radical SAM enzyme